jgi:pilus assembly protein CpaE
VNGVLTLCVIGSRDDALVARLLERRIRVTTAAFGDLDGLHAGAARGPDAFVVDIRGFVRLPREIAVLRRLFPTSGLVIVAQSADPNSLLEAMRMGVNEWLAEPLNVDDLVAAVSRVARPVTRQRIGRTIAVVGAKGGVGATTVAVNLATSLHRASKAPTLLIDLHAAHGDAAVLLGAEPRFSVADALQNLHRTDESYLKGLATTTKAGIDLLSSSGTPPGVPFDGGQVRALIELAATAYRYVVLDCARSDHALLQVMDVASQVVVVANQELTTVRTAARLVDVLRQRCGSERVKVALSRLDPQADIARTDVERALGAPVAYVLPNDYRTSVSALTRGEPLVLQNHTRLASSLESVARDLGGLPRPASEAPKSGLFGRLGSRR